MHHGALFKISGAKLTIRGFPDVHARTQQKSMDNKDDQVPVEGDSDLRYHISPSKNQPVDIFDTIRKNRGDPAYHVCLTDSNYYDC
jgi:hypothetical protein